jgi:hypothetical protein
MKRYCIKRYVVIAVAVTALFASDIYAQGGQPATSPMTLVTDSQLYYNSWVKNFTALAEAMPAEHYDWVPPGITKEIAPDAQTFGQWITHATSTEQRMCSLIATGKDNPIPGLAEMKAKDEILAAWKKSMQTCAPIVAGLSMDNVSKIIDTQYGKKPLLSTIFNLTAHNRETYGEMLIYLRLKGLKAPGTQQGDPKDFDGKIYGSN